MHAVFISCPACREFVDIGPHLTQGRLVGAPICPACGFNLSKMSAEQMRPTIDPQNPAD